MPKAIKIIGKIFSFVGLTLASLISLIYFVMNIRILFSGDFNVYSSPAAGFFNVFFKAIMYLYIIGVTVFSYIYLISKKKSISWIYYLLSLGLLIITTLFIVLNRLGLSSGYEGYVSVALKVLLILGSVGAIFIYLYESKETAKEIE